MEGEHEEEAHAEEDIEGAQPDASQPVPSGEGEAAE